MLDPSNRRALADRLAACREAFLAQPAPGRQGNLQIIDLRRLRQRLGPRWPELRGRVAGVVDTILGRSLGPSDLSLQAADDCLYVLRVGAERRELERQGELLAAEATARLCGTIPGGATIGVTTRAFDLDAGLAGVASVAELKAQVEALGLASDRGDAHDFGPVLQRLRPRFRPILNLRKRLISAYQLAADPVDPRCDGDGRAQLDEWGVRQAIPVLQAPRRRLEPGLVVSVSYATLAAMRWREPFLHQCRRLPPHAADRLILEVLDLPAGLPQARVRDLMAYIRPFCLAIVARLPAPASDLGQLSASGIKGLSLAAAALPADDRAVAAALAALADSARALSMRTWLVEAGTARVCRAALMAGIDHLGGDALMPPLAQLGRAFMVSR